MRISNFSSKVIRNSSVSLEKIIQFEFLLQYLQRQSPNYPGSVTNCLSKILIDM